MNILKRQLNFHLKNIKIKPNYLSTQNFFKFSVKEPIGNNKLNNNNKNFNQVEIQRVNREFYKISLFVYGPLIYSTGSLLIQAFGYGNFYYFSFKSLAKNILLINCFNTGIHYAIGCERVNSTILKQFEYNLLKAVISFASCFSMFIFPSPYSFIINYSIFIFTSLSIANSLRSILPSYGKISLFILLVCLLAISYMLITYNCELMEDIQNETKLDKAVNFFEMSSEKEFNEKVKIYEKYLNRFTFNLLIAKDNNII